MQYLAQLTSVKDTDTALTLLSEKYNGTKWEFVGNGFEIDINDHVNEEMYESYLYVENLSDMQEQKSE